MQELLFFSGHLLACASYPSHVPMQHLARQSAAADLPPALMAADDEAALAGAADRLAAAAADSACSRRVLDAGGLDLLLAAARGASAKAPPLRLRLSLAACRLLQASWRWLALHGQAATFFEKHYAFHPLPSFATMIAVGDGPFVSLRRN